MKRRIALAVTGSFALWLLGCGAYKTPCTQGTCAGCCGADQTCLAGTTAEACGGNGMLCIACPNGQSCDGGLCR